MNVGLFTFLWQEKRRSWTLIMAEATQPTDQNFQKVVTVLFWDRERERERERRKDLPL